MANDKQLPALPSDPIRSTSEIRTSLATWRSAYNIVGPITEIASIPADYEVVVRSVTFGPNDYYSVDGGKVALKKTSLDKLASVVGISAVPDQCSVTRVERHVWFAEFVVSFRGLDGRTIVEKGSVELDVSEPDGEEYRSIVEKARSAQPPRDPAREIQQVRRFGARHAESKARLRAIRAALGIASLTKDEAQRPFLVATLLWSPLNPSPEIQRMIAEKELGLTPMIVDRQPRPLAIAEVDPEETEVQPSIAVQP